MKNTTVKLKKLTAVMAENAEWLKKEVRKSGESRKSGRVKEAGVKGRVKEVDEK
jgi:hypothetical protein